MSSIADGLCVFYRELEPARKGEVDALMKLLSKLYEDLFKDCREEPNESARDRRLRQRLDEDDPQQGSEKA